MKSTKKETYFIDGRGLSVLVKRGLLATTGLFLSSGLFLHTAEAQSLLCGQAGSLALQASADATAAARTARQAKKHSRALAEESVMAQLDQQATQSAANECPAECPGSYEVNEAAVESTHETTAYTDDEDREDFLRECQEADGAGAHTLNEEWSGMNMAQKAKYCSELYEMNFHDEGFIGKATAVGSAEIVVTCAPKRIGIKPKTRERERGTPISISGTSRIR